MEEVVRIQKKKQLIEWFLNKHPLKKPEAAKILNFLLNRDMLLGATHFVENVRSLPNALIISAADAASVSFLCRLNGVYYEDMDEILAILDYSPPANLYVWLSFDRSMACANCQAMVDLKPEVESELFYYQVVKKIEKEIFTKMQVKEECKALLMAEIDWALDCKDRDRFNHLVDQYKELVK